MDFEKKMNRLEEIAEQIKSGEVDFKKQLELFEEGSKLSAELEKELSKAEQIIEEISEGPQGEI